MAYFVNPFAIFGNKCIDEPLLIVSSVSSPNVDQCRSIRDRVVVEYENEFMVSKRHFCRRMTYPLFMCY